MIRLYTIIFLLAFSKVHSQVNLNFVKKPIPNDIEEKFSGAIDDDGFIWLAELKGAFRFNGLKFELFSHDPTDTTSITFGRVRVIRPGANRSLWFGTNTGGVSRLDLDTYKFETLTYTGHDSSWSLGGSNVGDIMDQGNGIIWIGTDDFCLNKVDWNAKKVTRYYPRSKENNRNYSNYLGNLTQDPHDDNILWVGSEHGIYRFDKETEHFKLFSFAAYRRQYKEYPIPIHIDTEGYIWSSVENGVIRIDPATGDTSIINLVRPDHRYGQGWHAAVIKEFSDKEIIIATAGDGLIVVNRETLDFFVVNNDRNIARGINFYEKDMYGNIWFSSNEGLYLSPPSRPSTERISLRSIPGMNWSRSLLPVPETNNYYVGTKVGHGLLFIDPVAKKVKSYPYRFDTKTQGDVFMRDLDWFDERNIWVATFEGLLKFNTQSSSYKKTQLDNSELINSVCQCATKTWINDIEKGLYSFIFSADSLSSLLKGPDIHNVTEIFCLGETLWIGTQFGLYNYDQETEKTELVIPSIHVSKIIEMQNILWIGTKGQGLYHFDFDKKDYKRYNNTYRNNLNFIYHLAESKDQKIWLNTDGGTVQFDIKDNSFTNFIAAGLGKKAPIIELPNGMVMSGASRSIEYFNAESAIFKGYPPKIYITKIEIGNHEEDFELVPNLINEITLKPHQKELIIEFDAINYNVNSSTSFSYRLSGNENGWQQLGDKNYLNFYDLKAGEHTLKLVARNAYGLASTEAKKLIINVQPALHEQLWFPFSMFLLSLSIIYFYHRYAKKRAREKSYENTVEYFTNSRYAENSVDEILWDVTRNVISRLKFEDCVIYLLDKETKMLKQKAAYGIKNEQGREILNPLAIPFGEGIVGNCAASKTPIIVNDTSKDARYIVDLVEGRSEIAVPIIYEDQVLGVLDSEHTKTGFYDKTHAIVLSRIAKECAQKLANALANEKIASSENELLQVQKQIAESKLTALQAQMNPHFIFNSLNSINWYILKNKPQEASIYLSKFSKLVRLILDNSGHLTITLKKEMEGLRLYLDLESMRFEDSFAYDIIIDQEIDQEEILIPPLLLQPFVENAIWHGFLPKQENGKLLIQIYPADGHLKCIVQDNGIGRAASRMLNLQKQAQDRHKSRGITLTTDRIALLHRNFITKDLIKFIDLVDDLGHPAGTRVEVVIPDEF